jgi:hypothetical protein
MAEVTITTAADRLRGYFARRRLSSPGPGVIVLHDAAGMSRDCVIKRTGWMVPGIWPWHPTCWPGAEAGLPDGGASGPERGGEDHYRYRWARDRAAPPAGLIRVIGLDPHRHRVGLHAIVAAWAICSAEGDVF